MIRIQRQRTKGWRMPPGAIYVGRWTEWGNPWAIGERWPDARTSEPLTARDVVALFASYAEKRRADDPDWLDPLRNATALACWCPLDQPCHADVLIELLAEQA